MPVSTAPSSPRLRVLVVTKLYPNRAEPNLAAFNRQQFRALGALCDLDILATIPWFPGARFFGRWSNAGRTLEVPATDERDGFVVRHPRVLFVPKVGHAVAPALYAASLLPRVRAWKGRVDVVLASWAAPDGVAGVWLARALGVPAVVKVHGSDINVLGATWWGKPLLGAVLPRADRLVAVSRPLIEKLTGLGVPRDRIAFVPNGVNRALFQVRDRAEARALLGEPTGGRWIVYVGRLEASKGVLDLLAAFPRVREKVPDARLVLVGGGSELDRLRKEAAASGGHLLVAGSRPLEEVARFMAAADLVTLPSWNEGTPNVLLEALASGRRIVATEVGGIPDVVTGPRLGRLVPARDPGALAEALAATLSETYDPQELAAAAPPDWSESARQLHAVLASVAGGTHQDRGASGASPAPRAAE